MRKIKKQEQSKLNYCKKEKAITLIALVITIIVLLILAGVSIATLTGENGILTRANDAKEEIGRATAEEKVEVEVLGSYDNNGNIDLDKLNENLENIEGLTLGLPVEELPAVMTVDGYEVVIRKDGKVNRPGKWREKTNEQQEKIITDGTVELRIGDYVNYDPTNGGEISTVYTSLQGTYHEDQSEAIADTSENMKEGNGYADQTFSVAVNTNGWRVLGIDENTDEILLISTDVVKTIDNNKFYMKGQTGYEWGEKELNEICKIFGQGKGASGARSITIDDINEATGYNPEIAHCYDTEIYEYGNEVTYTKVNNGVEYQDTLNNNKGIENYPMFRYYDEKNNIWKTLKEGNKQKLKSTAYLYYPNTLTDNVDGETVGIDPSSVEYEMLFSRTSEGEDYWLASPCIRTHLGVSGFCLRRVAARICIFGFFIPC